MSLIEQLGLTAPIIQAPMAGVSTPRMAAAICNAGALGSIAVADAELIMKGLPPRLCRRADPATAKMLRSKPVSVS